MELKDILGIGLLVVVGALTVVIWVSTSKKVKQASSDGAVAEAVCMPGQPFELRVDSAGLFDLWASYSMSGIFTGTHIRFGASLLIERYRDGVSTPEVRGEYLLGTDAERRSDAPQESWLGGEYNVSRANEHKSATLLVTQLQGPLLLRGVLQLSSTTSQGSMTLFAKEATQQREGVVGALELRSE